jgi:hydrophobe/amphiphile efflux-3 (HAE3) family protein
VSIERIVDGALAHRRVVIVVLLLVTAVFGAGATMVEQSTSIGDFQTDSTEAEKLDYVQANFSAAENTTAAQVIVRDENVLDRETLLDTLEIQQAFRETETVDETLVANDTFLSIGNLVAVSSIHRERQATLAARQAELNATSQQLGNALEELNMDADRSIEDAFEAVRAGTSIELSDEQYRTFEEAAKTMRSTTHTETVMTAYEQGTKGVLAAEYAELNASWKALDAGLEPSLSAQHDQLASMSDGDVTATVEQLLDTDDGQLLSFMPDGYEPGETRANATVALVTQDTGGEPVTPGAAPQEIIDAQYEMQTIAEDHDGADAVVFGSGIVANEFDTSMSDSMAIVGPIALLFVLVVLLIAYRDLLDVALGLFGIVAVLIWTFGFMGWTGIKFGQIFIAVPVLLIGLSIDYAIHVIMRGREAGTDTNAGTERAMAVGLAGVGFALVLVTVTTAAGFLSNLVSPIPPIQKFGIVNAVGIVATLFVFGLLVPALKVEIDTALEARGIDRQRGAFGTSGRLEPVLRTGERIARVAPVAMLLFVLLLSAGGVYGATQVDTSFSTDQFIAEDPPGWTENLPDSLQPAEYTAASTIDYLDETFVRQQLQTHILVEGDPTDPETLAAAATGETGAANADSTRELVNGEAAVRGPVSTMERVAATNESFNQTLAAADTTGDGVPDTNLEQVYDELFAANAEQATAVVHRTDDGEYRALRIVSFAAGDATRGETTDEMQTVADQVEGDEITATATGQQTVLFSLVSEELFDTVVQSLVLTLGAVILFLTAASHVTGRSATLGVVTTLPVVVALSWVLGTMYLLDIPFNSTTGMITSLSIGLGVAYSIHVSQRYRQQLDRTGSVGDALRTTVTGTGGALLGSATTTAGGFGVLVFAFVPALQQFGFITALSIVYAFLASVLVLPSLLVLWTRWFGPAALTETDPMTTPDTTPGDD